MIPMREPAEPEWDLAIGPDTIRNFVLKARAVGAAMREDYDDGSEHEVEIDADAHDTHHHQGLVEEETEDLREEELRELLQDLNDDEAADLIALVWIGRGDYEASEWQEALAEARGRGRKRLDTYLMRLPMLAEWLEEGLEAIGA
jgi:Protein of unknown function (DUF3775)